MVLLGILVGGGAWWWSQPVRVTAPAGTQQTVTLAGGSEVHLNGATTLTYPRGWGALPFGEAPVRRVRLAGEAFFEVTSGRPFRVQTANATVEVLGTAFNVRARRQDGMPTTDVTVRSGQVRVSAQARTQSEQRGRTSTDPAVGATDEPSGAGSASDSSVVLSAPGHYTQVRGSRARPTPPARADLKYATAWRTGGFAVRNAALSTVLRELEARFGTSLRLAPGVDTGATDSLTLFYGASAGLENILSDIGAVQNLSYRKHSQGYEFVPRN
jgi:transmembrane sensor